MKKAINIKTVLLPDHLPTSSHFLKICRCRNVIFKDIPNESHNTS